MLHRVIALSFILNAKNLSQVNHIDGNKQNNRVDNLEWVDSYDNQKHACFVLGKRIVYQDMAEKSEQVKVMLLILY